MPNNSNKSLAKVDYDQFFKPEMLPKKIQDTWNPAIPNLHKTGKDAVKLIANQLLKSIKDYFSGSEVTMDMEHFIRVAEGICERYPTLKINEAQLVVKKAAFLDFGPIYNKVDIPAINGWFKAYYKERADFHAQMTENQNDAKKNEANEVSPEAANIFRELGAKMSAKSELDNQERLRRIALAQINGKNPDPNDMRKLDEKDIRP